MKKIANITCLSYEKNEYEYYNKYENKTKKVTLQEAIELAKELIPTYKINMPMLIHSELKKEGFLNKEGNYINNK